MFHLNSTPSAAFPRGAVAAAVCLSLLSVAMPARAQEAQALPEVIVSASRMPQALQTSPIGASVITADDIQRSGVSDANEAIRKLAGVSSKSDLNGGRENRLDLRGYGETADANMVVMVDGIRISENEMAPARLSAIPLDQIERIEIIRGGSSVLWGEGASAGVINVVLKRTENGQSFGRVSAAVESFNGHDLQGSGQWAVADHVTLEGAARQLRSDGYRDNSAFKQDTGSLGIQWADKGWRAKFRVQQEDQSGGLPGSLSFQQFAADPRQASSPTDYAQTEETRYVGNLEYTSGPWTGQLDLGSRRKHSVAEFFGITDTTSRNDQVSPRLAYASAWGSVGASGVVGLDFQRWTFDGDGYYGHGTGSQSNRAVFVHSDLTFPTKTRLSLGARRERVEKEGNTSLTGVSYDRQDWLSAHELAVNQTVVRDVNVYARVASSYRLFNVDDARLTLPQQTLNPQKNRDKEVGLKWAHGAHSATVRWFVQNTTDEIAYFPVLGVNANLDPTRREGYELEGRWSPLPQWDWSATWQHVDATYRGGPYAGLKQTLVAPETGTVRTTYRFNEHHLVDVGVQYLAAMRFNDDTSNQCARKIPESALLDARYAWSDKAWTVALSGTNLTNEHAYNYAYSCTFGSLYPEPGRAFKLSVSRQF